MVVAVDVSRRISDPKVRRDLQSDLWPEWLLPIGYLFRLFETFGTYVKNGILSERIVFDLWLSVFIDNWDRLAPAIVVIRRSEGPVFMENFEMLACLARIWKRKGSRYPARLPRIAPEDRWLSEDRGVVSKSEG